jgi:hypothetical protein
LFLYIIFFLPIFNFCFRPHPRDDSECSQRTGPQLRGRPPIRYPAVCNSLVAQGHCLSLAGIQQRCSEAHL